MHLFISPGLPPLVCWERLAHLALPDTPPTPPRPNPRPNPPTFDRSSHRGEEFSVSAKCHGSGRSCDRWGRSAPGAHEWEKPGRQDREGGGGGRRTNTGRPVTAISTRSAFSGGPESQRCCSVRDSSVLLSSCIGVAIRSTRVDEPAAAIRNLSRCGSCGTFRIGLHYVILCI